MPKRSRLTNNSDETSISLLLSGDSVFVIPYFQRAYKWGPDRLKQLNQDLLNLVDDADDFHFLGAVIIHGRKTNPSDPDVYEVIDGQQRITTIYLYLCAIVRILCLNGEHGEATGLFLKYLAIGRETKLVSNAKLHSCKDDRAQLNYVLRDILSDETLARQLAPFDLKPLPGTASDKGRLRNNYRAALRFFSDQAEIEGIARVKALLRALLESISVVQIDVWDPTSGPKIFDSLNSRQEPMTTGDLVRNEIFARIADRAPEDIEDIDTRCWQPFYHKFKLDDADLFDSYFFPYGLILDPNARKGEVYSFLRDSWKDIKEPETIIKALATYQNAFLDVASDSDHQGHPKQIRAAFSLLHSAKAPSSTYPFLMQLSNGIKSGVVKEGDGLAIVRMVESFLVRRAICGHEPTGLHAVFKRLWTDCEGTYSPDAVRTALKKHRTVAWPDGPEVTQAIETRPLYGSSITSHILKCWNASLGGDPPGGDPWIEHVLPDHPDSSWTTFSAQEQESMKHLLANLLPLSREMNQSLGNGPYSEKLTAYREDSTYKAARRFAAEYPTWTPDSLKARTQQLAAWAIDRWNQ